MACNMEANPMIAISGALLDAALPTKNINLSRVIEINDCLAPLTLLRLTKTGGRRECYHSATMAPVTVL